MNDPLSFQDVTDNIAEAMMELDGEQVAEIHNRICSRKIDYKEDSLWEYNGEDDNA
jgi:aminoglycoside phosphotransferase family enzyme